ncbi:MAG: hypothetical protein KC486_20180 [Myxococcales bacterium]|nr:hypothetical protein [Myxococcales bacterium]
MHRFARIVAVAALVAGCTSDPEVSVSTRVGEVESPQPPTEALREGIDAYRRWLGTMPSLSLGGGDDELADDGDGDDATANGSKRERGRKGAKSRRAKDKEPAPPPPPPRPPKTEAEFEAAVAALRKGPVEDVAIPANNLALAGPELWPAIRERLLAPRKSRKVDYRALLDLIGGDVPNRYGHFERAWKRAHGYDVKLSEDWFGDLLALSPRKIGRSFHGIYRDVVLETALLKAAAKIGATRPDLVDEVTATLLDSAYVHEGTFRDEVGRALRAVGDPAIPELVRSSVKPAIDKEDDRFETPYRRAEYAEYQLDALDRLQPQRAVAAALEDPHLLAAILAAYGERRFPDAAEVLLEYVDAGIPRIRRAAREAFLAYVTGPAPAPERKVLRLLGGKTSSAKAGQTYRDTAAIAIRERLEAEAPDLVEEPCKIHLPEGGRDESCERQPERHTHAYLAFLDARRAAEEEASIVAALAHEELGETITALDRLLVANPTRMADGRVIDAYRRAAEEALSVGQHSRAGQLLRKTAMLIADRDPEGRRTLTIQALLAEAESDGLSPEGRAMLLTTAEALAPDDPELQAAVAKIRSQRAHPSTSTPLRLGGGLALVAMILLMLSLAGSRTGPWLHRPRESV